MLEGHAHLAHPTDPPMVAAAIRRFVRYVTRLSG
jgi:hypothetical protein